jgi:hypothetical protein
LADVFDELARLIERHGGAGQFGFVVEDQKRVVVRFRHFQEKLGLVRQVSHDAEVIRTPKESAIQGFGTTARVGFINIGQALRRLTDHADDPLRLHLHEVDLLVVVGQVDDDVDRLSGRRGFATRAFTCHPDLRGSD